MWLHTSERDESLPRILRPGSCQTGSPIKNVEEEIFSSAQYLPIPVSAFSDGLGVRSSSAGQPLFSSPRAKRRYVSSPMIVKLFFVQDRDVTQASTAPSLRTNGCAACERSLPRNTIPEELAPDTCTNVCVSYGALHSLNKLFQNQLFATNTARYPRHSSIVTRSKR